MKLVVLGATGRTGRLVVEQALAAGHNVTALVVRYLHGRSLIGRVRSRLWRGQRPTRG